MANQIGLTGLSLNISKKVKHGMNEQCELFSLKSMPDKFVRGPLVILGFRDVIF